MIQIVDINLEIDTPSGYFGGEIAAKFAFLDDAKFDASVTGTYNNAATDIGELIRIDSVSANLNNANIPLFATGITLTKISFEVSGLQSETPIYKFGNDKNDAGLSWEFGAGIASGSLWGSFQTKDNWVLGASLNIGLAKAIGAENIKNVAKVTKIGEDFLDNANIFEVEGEISKKGANFLGVEGNFELFGGVLAGQAAMQIKSKGIGREYELRGVLTVSGEKDSKFSRLATGEVAVNITYNDRREGETYYTDPPDSIWGNVGIKYELFGTIEGEIGLFFRFEADGYYKFNALKSVEELRAIKTQFAPASVSDMQAEYAGTAKNTAASVSDAAHATAQNLYAVSESKDYILLNVTWNKPNANAAVQIVLADGTIVHSDDFGNYDNIEIVEKLTTDQGVTVAVMAPDIGTYGISVLSDQGIGEAQSFAVQNMTLPTIKITTIENGTAHFHATTSDLDAVVRLYADTDGTGGDGVLVSDDLAIRADGSYSLSFDLSNIVPGDYHIYAVLSTESTLDQITYFDSTVSYRGSEVDKIINGDAGNNILSGDRWNNKIDGFGGNDTLSGKAGDDKLRDGLGNDRLDGGAGFDALIALSGANELKGGLDADFLLGGFEADQLESGDGNDVIRGDASDLLGGADLIRGGTGDDMMMGGRGADIFAFRVSDGNDVIGRFNVGDVVFDTANGYKATVGGADFQSGIDHIRLEGFSTVNASNVLSSVTDGADGAVFSAEGTSITFFGVTAGQLSNDDFIFV